MVSVSVWVSSVILGLVTSVSFVCASLKQPSSVLTLAIEAEQSQTEVSQARQRIHLTANPSKTSRYKLELSAPSSSPQDPATTQLRPKWFEPCNEHTASIVNVSLRRKFTLPQVKSRANSSKHRATRSINTNVATYSTTLSHREISSHLEPIDDRDAIYVKQSPRRAAKKTSFSALAKSYGQCHWCLGKAPASAEHRRPVSKSTKYEQTGFAASKQSRARPQWTHAATRHAKSSPETYKHNDNLTNSLIDQIHSTDIRASWLLSATVNSLADLKRVNGEIELELELSSGSARNASAGPRAAESRHERWLPRLGKLVRRANRLQQSEELLAGLSHLMQYFSVAIEQMLFEQHSRADQKLAKSYELLEQLTLECLCSSQKLVGALRELRSNRKRLVERVEVLQNKQFEDAGALARFLNTSVVYSMENHLFYFGDSLELAPEVGARVERNVMPTEQRKLASSSARVSRDLSIHAELDKLVSYYLRFVSTVDSETRVAFASHRLVWLREGS